MRLLELFIAVVAAAGVTGLLPSGASAKVEIDSSIKPTRQVAIIGAGAAGSSAAYHLHKFAKQAGIAVNITLFEKTDHIGGRTLTVNALDNPLEPVELGASIFIKLNHILWNATQEFGLPTKKPGAGEGGLLAVWDGDRIVYQQDETSWGWWNLAKLFWKYGMAPYRTQKLMKSTIGKFTNLYKAPFFPFRSLTQRAFELELAQITGQTGEQFLTENKIGDLFSHDIIQASTRVNYASNLADIHGLDTMVAMAPEGAMAVAGGNWQIFHNMVQKSKAYVELNISISSIALGFPEPGSTHNKFVLKTRSAESTVDSEETHPLSFDNVIIATPYQFSNITAVGDVMQHPIEQIPYVRLHVTLFTSGFRISPSFCKLDPAAKVPTTFLTTLAESDDPASGATGAGKAGFFSISTLRTVTNARTLKDEYLYKIFSPEKVTAEFLSSLLGVKVPETITGKLKAEGGADQGTQSLEPITWYYPHVFHSYPKALPRVTFQDPIITAGLYYTSGIEGFISTMETSALMGMNVAKLIVDDVLDSLKEGDLEDAGEEKPAVREGAEGQKILGNERESFPGEL